MRFFTKFAAVRDQSQRGIPPGAEYCRLLKSHVGRRFDGDMIVMDNGILRAGRAEHAMWLAWRLSRRLFSLAAAVHLARSNI